LLGLLFDPEDGCDMFLRNFSWLSTDYMCTALYSRSQNSSSLSLFLRFCTHWNLPHSGLYSEDSQIFPTYYIQEQFLIMKNDFLETFKNNSTKNKMLPA
jgi:hypothetical protein